MKRILTILALAGAMVSLSLPAAITQRCRSVKGVAKDMEGKPIVGATVEFANSDTSRKYDLKTNNKGNSSLGLRASKMQKLHLTRQQGT